jgi:hypothetical protein
MSSRSHATATGSSIAVRMLEALAGTRRTEEMGRDGLAAGFDDLDVDDKGAMVAVVAAANLERLPDDATSVRAWLDRARRALGAT